MKIGSLGMQYCSMVKKYDFKNFENFKNRNQSQSQNSVSNVYEIPSFTVFTGKKSKSDLLMERLQKNTTPPSILGEIEELPQKDKKEFIKKYCAHTGFPNLDVVNKKIKTHEINVINEGAKKSGDTGPLRRVRKFLFRCAQPRFARFRP